MKNIIAFCLFGIVMAFSTFAFSQSNKSSQANLSDLKNLRTFNDFESIFSRTDVKTNLSQVLPKEKFDILYSKTIRKGKGFRYAIGSKDEYIFLDSMSLFGDAEYQSSVIINTKENSVNVCWKDLAGEAIIFSKNNPPRRIQSTGCSQEEGDLLIKNYFHGN